MSRLGYLKPGTAFFRLRVLHSRALQHLTPIICNQGSPVSPNDGRVVRTPPPSAPWCECRMNHLQRRQQAPPAPETNGIAIAAAFRARLPAIGGFSLLASTGSTPLFLSWVPFLNAENAGDLAGLGLHARRCSEYLGHSQDKPSPKPHGTQTLRNKSALAFSAPVGMLQSRDFGACVWCIMAHQHRKASTQEALRLDIDMWKRVETSRFAEDIWPCRLWPSAACQYADLLVFTLPRC